MQRLSKFVQECPCPLHNSRRIFFFGGGFQECVCTNFARFPEEIRTFNETHGRVTVPWLRAKSTRVENPLVNNGRQWNAESGCVLGCVLKTQRFKKWMRFGLSKFLVLFVLRIGLETRGLLDFQGRRWISSVVRWHLRPVIFGTKPNPFTSFYLSVCFSPWSLGPLPRRDPESEKSAPWESERRLKWVWSWVVCTLVRLFRTLELSRAGSHFLGDSRPISALKMWLRTRCIGAHPINQISIRLLDLKVFRTPLDWYN